jgi:hypothetical protein
MKDALPAMTKKDEEEVSAPADLLRGHGLLNRVLLIERSLIRSCRGLATRAPHRL